MRSTRIWVLIRLCRAVISENGMVSPNWRTAPIMAASSPSGGFADAGISLMMLAVWALVAVVESAKVPSGSTASHSARSLAFAAVRAASSELRILPPATSGAAPWPMAATLPWAVRVASVTAASSSSSICFMCDRTAVTMVSGAPVGCIPSMAPMRAAFWSARRCMNSTGLLAAAPRSIPPIPMSPVIWNVVDFDPGTTSAGALEMASMTAPGLVAPSRSWRPAICSRPPWVNGARKSPTARLPAPARRGSWVARVPTPAPVRPPPSAAVPFHSSGAASAAIWAPMPPVAPATMLPVVLPIVLASPKIWPMSCCALAPTIPSLDSCANTSSGATA